MVCMVVGLLVTVEGLLVAVVCMATQMVVCGLCSMMMMLMIEADVLWLFVHVAQV